MIIRPAQLRPIPKFLLPSVQSRCLHQRMVAPPIPEPTPFVPNAQTFLTLIGRNLSQHASKIPTWESLFSLTSTQLRELGVDPPRSRRYLLRWREKFRKGEFGAGGDLKYVENGVAEIRIAEVPAEGHTSVTATSTPGTRKIVVNLAPGMSPVDVPTEQLEPIKGFKIKGSQTITGSHVQPVKGGGMIARIVVKEGLWEDRRGHKIDGGERRQAEVRSKRRGEERRSR